MGMRAEDISGGSELIVEVVVGIGLDGDIGLDEDTGLDGEGLGTGAVGSTHMVEHDEDSCDTADCKQAIRESRMREETCIVLFLELRTPE